MFLYKDKECTQFAICPIKPSICNCDTRCAWCEWHKFAPYGENNIYYCGGANHAPHLFAKEEE